MWRVHATLLSHVLRPFAWRDPLESQLSCDLPGYVTEKRNKGKQNKDKKPHRNWREGEEESENLGGGGGFLHADSGSQGGARQGGGGANDSARQSPATHGSET